MDAFWVWLLRLAEKYNVAIRILEGTFLPDRRQARRAVWLHEHINSSVDLVYADKMMVERIDRFNLSVLYIPDDLNGKDTDKTYEQAKALLASRGLKQADIIAMHGLWDYRIPKTSERITHHVSERYSKLARGVVLCGHDHTHTVRGNILNPGSYDRLRHGQEET